MCSVDGGLQEGQGFEAMGGDVDDAPLPSELLRHDFLGVISSERSSLRH